MKVVCGNPTGFRLRVGDEEIVLKPGVNDVNDVFWTSWFDGSPATALHPAYPDHHDFSPILDGLIIAYKDEPPSKPEPEKPGVAPKEDA